MCVCVCVCAFVFMCVCVRLCVYVYMCEWVHAWVSGLLCACLRVSVCLHRITIPVIKRLLEPEVAHLTICYIFFTLIGFVYFKV